MYGYIYDFFKNTTSSKVIKSFDEDLPDNINYRDEYIKRKAWGMSMSLDCKNCNPEYIKSPEKIKKYVIELCDLIGMNRYGECQIIHFGKDEKEGYTAVQLIETSNITCHFSNDTNSAYIDLFSCKPYDPREVKRFTSIFFESNDVDIQVVIRK